MSYATTIRYYILMSILVNEFNGKRESITRERNSYNSKSVLPPPLASYYLYSKCCSNITAMSRLLVSDYSIKCSVRTNNRLYIQRYQRTYSTISTSSRRCHSDGNPTRILKSNSEVCNHPFIQLSMWMDDVRYVLSLSRNIGDRVEEGLGNVPDPRGRRI
jgi:hypothetical protein